MRKPENAYKRNYSIFFVVRAACMAGLSEYAKLA
jgi:hypothetical protein